MQTHTIIIDKQMKAVKRAIKMDGGCRMPQGDITGEVIFGKMESIPGAAGGAGTLAGALQ